MASTKTPILCARTKDRKSARQLFINFKANDAIQSPESDFNEEDVVRVIRDQSPDVEQFKIPLVLSQIYWTKPSNELDESTVESDYNYVINVELNDKFAFSRVVTSEIMRHYLISVTMATIESKYSDINNKLPHSQTLGHELELDQGDYEFLETKLEVEHSDELVASKIMIVSESDSSTLTNEQKSLNNDIPSFDAHFRPRSMLLTFSIGTDKLPDELSFNDDHFILKSAGKSLVDVCLPLEIDLTEPVRYRFDDRFELFRVVFKVKEPQLIETDVAQ